MHVCTSVPKPILHDKILIDLVTHMTKHVQIQILETKQGCVVRLIDLLNARCVTKLSAELLIAVRSVKSWLCLSNSSCTRTRVTRDSKDNRNTQKTTTAHTTEQTSTRTYERIHTHTQTQDGLRARRGIHWPSLRVPLDFRLCSLHECFLCFRATLYLACPLCLGVSV